MRAAEKFVASLVVSSGAKSRSLRLCAPQVEPKVQKQSIKRTNTCTGRALESTFATGATRTQLIGANGVLVAELALAPD